MHLLYSDPLLTLFQTLWSFFLGLAECWLKSFQYNKSILVSISIYLCMCKFKCLNQKFVNTDTVYLVTILNVTSVHKSVVEGKIFNGQQLSSVPSVTHTNSFR